MKLRKFWSVGGAVLGSATETRGLLVRVLSQDGVLYKRLMYINVMVIWPSPCGTLQLGLEIGNIDGSPYEYQFMWHRKSSFSREWRNNSDL